MTSSEPHHGHAAEQPVERRDLLTNLSTTAMVSGMAAGYGAFAVVCGRFLYPSRPTDKAWMFVARVADLAPGASMSYRAPNGARVNIARHGETGTVDDFVALSSTCPHLGCQVHWEPHNNRFFCPCHNGVFSPDGVATAGPPAEAGQSLPRYPLEIDRGLLYIEVPTARLAAAFDIDDSAPRGPGHDPCLSQRPPADAC